MMIVKGKCNGVCAPAKQELEQGLSDLRFYGGNAAWRGYIGIVPRAR